MTQSTRERKRVNSLTTKATVCAEHTDRRGDNENTIRLTLIITFLYSSLNFATFIMNSLKVFLFAIFIKVDEDRLYKMVLTI